MSPCIGDDVRQDVIADLKLAQASCRSDIDDLQARFWELQKQFGRAVLKLQDDSLVSTARGASGKESECSGDPSSGIQSKLVSKSTCLPPDDEAVSQRFEPSGSSPSQDQEGIDHTTATASFSSAGCDSIEEESVLLQEAPPSPSTNAAPQVVAVPTSPVTPPLESEYPSPSHSSSPTAVQTRLRLPPPQSLAPTGATRTTSSCQEHGSNSLQASDNKLASSEAPTTATRPLWVPALEFEALKERFAELESRQTEYVEKLDAALDAARTGIFKLARELHRDQDARKKVFEDLKATGQELGKSCVKPALQSAKEDLRGNLQSLMKQEASKLQTALDARWQLLLAELRATASSNAAAAATTTSSSRASRVAAPTARPAAAAATAGDALPLPLMTASASVREAPAFVIEEEVEATKTSISPIGRMLEQMEKLEEQEEVEERLRELQRLQEERRREKRFRRQLSDQRQSDQMRLTASKSSKASKRRQSEEKEESAPPEVSWYLGDWLPSNVDGGEEATKQMLLQVGASAELSDKLGNISIDMLVSRPTARLLYRVALAMQSVTGFPAKLPAVWPETGIDKMRFIQQLWKDISESLQLKDVDCQADEVMRCTNRTHTRRIMQLLTIAAVKERSRIGAQCAEEACRLPTQIEETCSSAPSLHSSPATTSRAGPDDVRPDEVVVASLGIVKLHAGLACRPASALQKRSAKGPGKTLLRAMSAGRLQTAPKSKSLNRLWEALEAAGEASKAAATNEHVAQGGHDEVIDIESTQKEGRSRSRTNGLPGPGTAAGVERFI